MIKAVKVKSQCQSIALSVEYSPFVSDVSVKKCAAMEVSNFKVIRNLTLVFFVLRKL